jgi:hypothetical protein
MKTCKYGCGKMKEGSKVATIKKMKVGGNTADPCFPLCLVDGKCKKCTSTRIGDALVKAGAAIFGTKLGKDILKKRNSKKNQTAKTEAAQETVQEKRIGGATKKTYKTGGATLPMMGMPMYSNNPRSEQGRILKAGGSTTNRAVKPGCTGGMVKDASGKCVMERKMQDGGSKTKKNIITGRTRVTTPYAVGAPSKGTVAPRDYSTGTKTEVYSKKGDLVKTKYKHRGTGKYDTENSRYPYNYVREEEKPGGEKKEKYPILPSYMQPADKLKKVGGATTSKTLKPVPAGKPGLAKLPTAVRNKMGFQKKGGAVKKKK